MTAVVDAGTGAFTAADHRRRIERMESVTAAAGLSGVLVAPGPDLRWLIGFRPVAATGWPTVLVVVPGRAPTLVVPADERRRLGALPGAPDLAVRSWPPGADPYR